MRGRGAGVTVRVARLSSVVTGGLTVAIAVFLAIAGRFDEVVGVIPFAALTAPYAVVAHVIALRHPENRLHWVLRVVALSLPAWALALTIADAWVKDPAAYPLGPLFAWVGNWLGLSAIIVPLTLVPLLFPTGRLLTPRWRPFLWFLIGFFLAGTVATAFAPGPLSLAPSVGNNPFGAARPLGQVLITLRVVAAIAILPALLGCLVAVAVRFKRARGIERQQMKWFVFSVTFAVALPLYIVLAPSFNRIVPGLSSLTDVLRSNASILFALSFGLPPVAIGIAILRYRLYDIDVLINRTLVYGSLTTTLGAGYIAAVVLLGAALRPLTGGGEVAVAASTLGVVALFTPLRRRIQAAVDRRFYRLRYNAERTLERFAARLGSEVELDSVRADLVAVVHETMRPAHANVWLRDRAR